MTQDRTHLRTSTLEAVDRLEDDITRLSRYVYENPEVAYEEVKAAAEVADLLERHGFTVERGVASLPTALSAQFGTKGPTIAFLAEYDALPKLGHACGHNLICAMSVGAALACKEAGLPARVLLVGTPAEESGGGKVKMTEAGIFDGLDAVMMIHPSNYNTVGRTSLAMRAFKLRFRGKAAHASGRPEQGINALEAAVQTYVAINGLRQHLPSEVRVHGIFTHGGDAPNIVPDYAELYYYVRALTLPVLEDAFARVLASAKGAALATGATLEHEVLTTYRERVESPALGRTFQENLQELGVGTIDPASIQGIGSSDIGNISHVAPTIHAYLKIAEDDVRGHTPEFCAVAGTDEAAQVMMTGVRTLALTAVDIATQPELIEEMRQEFGSRAETAA